MPLTETVTIINNSGKIISTGKSLFSVFKEAKDSYTQKKAGIRADRDIVQRSQAFEAATRGIDAGSVPQWAPPPPQPAVPQQQQHSYPPRAGNRGLGYAYDDYDLYGGHNADTRSRTSHRSHRSRRRSVSQTPSRTRDVEYHDARSRTRPALTERNLDVLSDNMSVAPSESASQINYKAPYAETAPRTMAMSRPTLHHYTTAPTNVDYQADRGGFDGGAAAAPRGFSAYSAVPPGPGSLTRAQTMGVGPHYDPTVMQQPQQMQQQLLQQQQPQQMQPMAKPKKVKEIDMNLAYGNVPPDLEHRIDLDPNYNKEQKARFLVGNIEGVLDEAKCVGSSATTIIKRLQSDPNAAASVALTLAELSKILSGMSPAFLGMLKGGSPAVFALLASPQFLIAAGGMVGLTVVMFGGWKIVKRIKESKEQQAEMQGKAMAVEAMQTAPQYWPANGDVSGTMLNGEAAEYYTGAPRGQSAAAYSGGPPRTAGGFGGPMGGAGGGGGDGGGGFDGGDPNARGFSPNGGGSQQSCDEALVLEEELSTIESWRRGISSFGEDQSVDLELISPEAQKAVRKQKKANERDRRRAEEGGREDFDDTRSERSSKSHRSSRSHRSHKSHHSSSHREHGRERERERERDDVSEAGSHRSHRSHRSTRSKRTERLAIEEAPAEKERLDPGLEYVLRPKKDSMLKSMFKKKERDMPRERDRVSALAF